MTQSNREADVFRALQGFMGRTSNPNVANYGCYVLSMIYLGLVNGPNKDLGLEIDDIDDYVDALVAINAIKADMWVNDHLAILSYFNVDLAKTTKILPEDMGEYQDRIATLTTSSGHVEAIRGNLDSQTLLVMDPGYQLDVSIVNIDGKFMMTKANGTFSKNKNGTDRTISSLRTYHE